VRRRLRPVAHAVMRSGRRVAVSMLPAKALQSYLSAAGRLQFVLADEGKRVVGGLLAEVLPPGHPDVLRIVQDLYRHHEMWSVPPDHPYWDRTLNVVEVTGEHFVEEAEQRGRGTIYLGSHFGPWPYLPRFFERNGLTADLYFPLGYPGRGLKHTRARNDFVVSALRILRTGGRIAFMGDFGVGRSVRVRFLGADVEYSVGFAYLALRTSATVLPVFCTTRGDSRQAVTIAPPISPDPRAASHAERIRSMVEAYTGLLERMIVSHPRDATKYLLQQAFRLPNG
jgi:lauroyl/myristoyl acyltransferase